MLECAEYRETGRCPRRRACPLPHPKRRKRDLHIKPKKATKAAPSRPEHAGVLGSADALHASLQGNQVRPKPAPARYFGHHQNVQVDPLNIPESPVNINVSVPIGQSKSSSDLNTKKQRIMTLVEKMKKRPGHNSDNIDALSPSAGVPLISGKYKIADEKDVIRVAPIIEYSSDASLPSFIPLVFPS